MKILLLVDDFDGPGINYDVKISRELLVKNNIKVIIFHFGKLNDPENEIYSFKNYNLIKLLKEFKNLYRLKKINITHIRGLMSKNHFLWTLCLFFTKASYVITGYSQLVSYNLNNKLFYENPDFKNINTSNKIRQKKFQNQLNNILKFLIPYFKKIYLYTVARILIKKSKGQIFFSKFEKNNSKIFNSNYQIIFDPILSKKNNKANLSSKFKYDQNKINIVFWGRLDVRLKGIDRIIFLANMLKKIDNKNLIHFHLMGPDYNNSVILINDLIKKNNLKNKISLYSKEIWSNNLYPFVAADYSILLGRWDGFPRSLRESISYDVPIIISEETNFKDVIEESNCGFLIDLKNEAKILLNFKSLLSNKDKILNFHKRNCEKAKLLISEDYHIKNLINFYKKSYGI